MEKTFQTIAVMYIVIDPNIVISALIKKGNSSIIFSLNSILRKYNFITPNFLFLEIGNNTIKIMKKTHFSEEEIEKEANFILNQITPILDEEYKNKEIEARQMLKEHEKDVPYLALALAFNCKILSGDKVLKSIIPDKIITPKELLDSF